jgi:thioesterase domain-containing protein
MVHDGVGEAICARMLSNHLDPQISIYGLDLDFSSAPTSIMTVEMLAEQMVHRIRMVQPTGTITLQDGHLGGCLHTKSRFNWSLLVRILTFSG